MFILVQNTKSRLINGTCLYNRLESPRFYLLVVFNGYPANSSFILIKAFIEVLSHLFDLLVIPLLKLLHILN